MEAELTAVTEQGNAKLTELSEQLDTLHTERTRLEEILQQTVRESSADDTTSSSADSLRQNDQYLRHELQQAMASYVAINEQMIALQKRLTELSKRNKILANRLRDNGLDSSIHASEAAAELAGIKRMTQSFQGILKYDTSNRTKILQRLLVDLTPRVAITMLPGLPAYIVFMCIR